MTNEFHRQRAKNDFDAARKEAALRRVMDRFFGRSSELMSFDDVKEKLGGIQGASGIRKEIPLEAVIGSVGRYNDFNRDFLPRAAHDRERWVRVRLAMEAPQGLPPVDVYQVGEAYFVIDGNHRVSIARRRGDTHIMAFVTEFRTRVGLSPDDSIEDLARKAEFADFLEKTKLDSLAPDEDFRVTEFGQYATLLQQIEMVHFIMMKERDPELTYEDAVKTWHLDYYLPVVEVIRDQNLLRHYPARTETDLYIWLLENKHALSEMFGWDVQLDSVAAELSARRRAADRVRLKIRQFLDPEHETGEWRERHMASTKGKLFSDIVVLFEGESLDAPVISNARWVAAREGAHLLGLLVESETAPSGQDLPALQKAFQERCAQDGIYGQLSMGIGELSDVVPSRTRWADLAVLPRPSHEGSRSFHRLLEKIRIPVWLAGDLIQDNDHLLLAFDGSPKSHEALFLSAYLAVLWGMDISVVTVLEAGTDRTTLEVARAYLETYGIEANYLEAAPPAAGAILAAAESAQAGLIVSGSYQLHTHILNHGGSTLDELIAQARVPLLVCR